MSAAEIADRPAEPAAAARRAGLTTNDWLVALTLAVVAGVVYLASNPYRPNPFDHFVWQAAAFLEGSFAIRWPVPGDAGNWYLHDVMPLAQRPGHGLLPFPPLPALVLMPLVAAFGLAADQSMVASLLGGLNVGIAWLLVRRLTADRSVALLATLFFGFGTVHWYAAMLGSAWYYAHVLAVTFTLLSITVALEADRRAELGLRSAQLVRRGWLSGRQFLAGLLLGVAALARLPVIFGSPFLLFVGGGGSFVRRALLAGVGAAIPVGLLLAYNLASTGHLLHPAYEYLYLYEYSPRPDLIKHEWMIVDPRYIPQNLAIMLLWPPQIRPECSLSPLSPDCPLLAPDPLAMSIILSSPAYLLIVPAVIRGWRTRLVQGAGLAVLSVGLFNLMHFSQGWVQFGYRFSNDFAPFALVLVTLGIAGLGRRWLAVALVGASMLINAWGVYWGIVRLW